MRIRARLLTLALSILIPAFLSCAVAIWFVYSQQQQAQEKSVRAAVKAFALLVDRNFRATEGLLETLAKSPDLANGQIDSFARQARLLVPGSERVIVLSEPDGQQLVNTRASAGAPLPHSNEALQQLRRQHPNASFVSGLFIGRVAKKKDVAVDVPVLINGAVKYRLSMGMQAAEMQTLIAEQNFPKEWLITIVDQYGMVVARSEKADQYVGKRVSGPLLARLTSLEGEGVNHGTTLDGRDVAAFFYRATASGWTTILSIPREEIRRPALYGATILSVVLLVMLGVAVALAGYFARETAAPIERLREAAEQLGTGAVVVLPAAGLTEIDAVGAALIRSSTLLREHSELLSARVAEAVASSEAAQRALLQSQKLEALGRLTGGVAHDFNNILQTLSSCLQLLRLTEDRTRMTALITTGEKAIRRATELTGQMRSFARVQDVRLETLYVADAVHSMVPLLSSSLQSSVTLRAEVSEQVWPVTVDKLQFELALLNIVINARDAMPRGGEIVLSTRTLHLAAAQGEVGPGDYVVVSIADQGTGMPPEVLARALDPFFTTKPVNQGTGLGLAQAYGFAKQSNGTLLLHSVEGQGTTIEIVLPRSNEALTAAADRPAAQPVRAAGNEVILFVEDDLLVRETVATGLRHAGLEVICVESGEAALAALASGVVVDAVFSDVVMPGAVSGVDLARIVLNTYPGLPVVLASGHTDVAINLPGVKLIGKPYDVMSVINLLAGTGA
ncbi:ATP-binding protein [Massilia sp. CF038]|uniref:hybrid sensor histidine kinase/response regulator n=1 Tax=Massilia sp. CF038 TaxID=1881045 RepID=UPI0009208F45|nr:ATP-binding protein [Massilia sp. CF038]SHG61719.1 HAMP domain-containing protein [Massilia sp. CF038]